MNKAIETILSIASNSNLVDADLKYCLMSKTKMPLKTNGTTARPNTMEDFVDLEELTKSPILDNCAGVGISVQASKVCAIDVDHCFSKPFEITSYDQRARDILDMFMFEKVYSEFSFSGTGMRILFRTDAIENYEEKYYIKNSNNQIEYYQPSGSNRYVSLTGRAIGNDEIGYLPKEKLLEFLNKYMLRPKPFKKKTEITEYVEDKTFEELWNKVKTCYLRDFNFQSVVLNAPPGKLKNPIKGQSESEKDFFIICYLYDNVSKDKDMIKKLFENTYYFKNKDYEHLKKWNNGYYFDFQFKNAASR